MPLYSYQGVNKKNRSTKGTIFGYSENQARWALEQKGIQTSQLTKIKDDVSWWQKPVGFVGFKDKIIFVKYMATILESGLSIKRALKTLSHQITNKYFRSIIGTITESIENGQSFNQSLRRHPRIFSEIFVSMIAAGEVSGTLPQSLKYLETMLTKSYRFRKSIRGAMMYPVMVMSLAIIVVLGIVRFIVPQLVPIFSQFGTDLPLGTKILLQAEKILNEYWWAALITIIILLTSFVLLLKIRKFKYTIHSLLLKIPLIGKLIKLIQVTRFAQLSSLLLHSGLTFVDTIQVSARTLKNLPYRDYLLGAVPYIESGGALSDYLHKRPDMFDMTIIQMVALGEETGNLEKTLGIISDLYEDELAGKLKVLSELIGPLVLIAVGTVIGGIAVAVVGPIYQLPRLVKNV